MRSIHELSRVEAQALHGVLFDLDDTFLSHGQLIEAAYGSLFRLQESGLKLFCVTGRPLAWGKLFARQWPLSGAVCENGAVAAYATEGRVEVVDSVNAASRRALQARLATLVAKIRGEFPTLEPATDAAERLSDHTFDIGEYRNVAPKLVAEVAHFAHFHAARTFVSSVHLHVSFDSHDKASGAIRFLTSHAGYDPTAARSRFAYIGDSENDAPCFAAFGTTIGVSNLRGRHTVPPRFITSAASGEGFVEATRVLVTARG